MRGHTEHAFGSCSFHCSVDARLGAMRRDIMEAHNV